MAHMEETGYPLCRDDRTPRPKLGLYRLRIDVTVALGYVPPEYDVRKSEREGRLWVAWTTLLRLRPARATHSPTTTAS